MIFSDFFNTYDSEQGYTQHTIEEGLNNWVRILSTIADDNKKEALNNQGEEMETILKGEL